MERLEYPGRGAGSACEVEYRLPFSVLDDAGHRRERRWRDVCRLSCAQRIAEWVNHVLSGDAPAAAEVARQFAEFPIALTRELATARQWLRDHRVDDLRRAGLVASSGALRLRAYGVEVSPGFRQGFKYEDWFLGPPDDVRSSSFLEVPATEFEIQGLEVDWTGVCWGNDFWFDSDDQKWRYQRFKGARWYQVKTPDLRQFVLNKYRVLLTRAREGMIVIAKSSTNRAAATVVAKRSTDRAAALRARRDGRR